LYNLRQLNKKLQAELLFLIQQKKSRSAEQLSLQAPAKKMSLLQ
jgi:hypothetical protein